jgi:O-acetyl-ADP-ribose deacetylase (regulator of RNase III)
MIERANGNLLEADADALVNTVNCVGVMGKGLALQFKQRHPENFRMYARACKSGEVVPGRVFVVQLTTPPPRFIINFPTKRHWRNPSRLEDIQAGLVSLIEEVRRLGIQSIAVPPLGCGNGGLDWSEVEPLIQSAFAQLPGVRVLLYAPDEGAPRLQPMAAERRSLTRARALFLKLIEAYGLPGYQLSKLELQKLAYFLQVAGEPLRLQFVKHHFGPYAHNLNHVLQHLEGHYIQGYGDGTQRSRIELLPHSAAQASSFLESNPEAHRLLERVSALIEGFETPYGMELLATTHWVAVEDCQAAADPERLVEKVHAWSVRKARTFKPAHIRKAWERLHTQGWLSESVFAAERTSGSAASSGS